MNERASEEKPQWRESMPLLTFDNLNHTWRRSEMTRLPVRRSLRTESLRTEWLRENRSERIEGLIGLTQWTALGDGQW